MIEDEFSEWLSKSGIANKYCANELDDYTDDFYITGIDLKNAYTAGRTQAERDIMARWPSKIQIMDFLQFGVDDYDVKSNRKTIDWLRSQLFPYDAQDEVKP